MELTLYVRPGCPFCAKVNDFLAEKNIEVPTKDITESRENRDELLNAGGKQQVPCLVIDGKALYESDAIIEWLKDNKTGS